MTTGAQRLAAADVIAKAKTKWSRVRIVLDGDLLDQHATLSVALDTAAEKDRKALAEQIVALEDEIAASEVEFVQRGIGRAKWRKLLADHPATDDEKAAGEHFGEGFPYEALAASLVDPVMTVEEVRELEESLDEVQFSTLWGACLRANLGSGSTRPESQAARAILANGRRRSPRPSDSESAEAS